LYGFGGTQSRGHQLRCRQSPAPTPGARLSNAGRSVPTSIQKEEVVVMMGALPPNPRDLSLLFSRMDGFFFTAHGTCRTIEMLDRKTGLRRDATRAPIQARNGWRPSGRRLGQPSAPSKDCRVFVQTMGPTSPNPTEPTLPLHAFQQSVANSGGCGIEQMNADPGYQAMPQSVMIFLQIGISIRRSYKLLTHLEKRRADAAPPRTCDRVRIFLLPATNKSASVTNPMACAAPANGALESRP
jgi:hypothetical protein